MKEFFIVRSADNVVIRHFLGPEKFADQQVLEGEYLVPLPDDFVFEPAANYVHDPDTGEITSEDNLGALRAYAIEAMTQACSAEIISGFSSSATGTSFHYPSLDTDQVNMGQVAIAGGKLWVMDGSESWSLLDHTATEGATVMGDFVSFRNSAQDNLVTKIASINAATTKEEIDAIVW